MTLQQSIVLALQCSILLTVFELGLQAIIDDVLYLVRRPSLLVRSFVAMFVIMPICAVVMARAFEFRRPVEIALIALAISPIPPLLPVRQQKAGGHASYGLGLMAIAGVLSVVTVPLSIEILSRYLVRSMNISPWVIAKVVLVAALLPLAAGLLCRAFLRRLAERIAKPVALIARALLAAGIVGLLAGALPAMFALIGNGTILAMAAFVLAGLAVGHWLGGPQGEHRLVLALSTASRHPAIALAVARVNFPDEPRIGAAILLYLLVNLLIGIPYQVLQRRRLVAQKPEK